MQRNKKWLIISVIAVLFLVTLFVQVYFVADHAGVAVFQKSDEAYLFVGGGHTGWHCPALAFPVFLALGYFGSVSEPSDQVVLPMVIEVTPQGVQRWVNAPVDVASLTPFQDGFYGLCPGAVLCKWTEKGFVRATPEEEKRIGVDNLHRGSLDNKLVNGWTTHELKFGPGDHFEVPLGKDLVIAVQNRSMKDGAYRDVTVDLLRRGQAPENLYHANGFPRRVSKSEYDQLFGKR